MDPGTQLGPYEIKEPLGAGGMGEVYRARDTKLDRDVAIKVLPVELADDPERLARLKREARLLAALNHPNIASIYGLEETEEDRPALVLELVEGPTLKERLETGPIAVEEALGIALQIAEGLEAAHERDIVHRDLKPGNVKVTASGTTKILDFGIAKPLRAQGEDARPQAPTAPVGATGAGAVMGTAAYMSPEQARGDPVDGRSDLFSLGAVLYEMVTGERPFEGRTAATTFDRVLNQDPEPPRARNSTLPASLSATIMRLLSKDREDRFPSAGELVSKLGGLRRDLRSSQGREPATDRADPGPGPLGGIAGSRGRSIAVLPFVNMSPDPDDEYFGDGLAEELINALTRVPGLRVAARTSAFCFKETARNIREIGETLQVDTVLEGSVRRSGGHLRITAQLVDVTDGYHLWSERYDREMADIFEIQDEITEAIVERLKLELASDEAPMGSAPKRRPTDDMEAYDLYLKGRHFWAQRTPDSFRNAIVYFEKALERDASFAMAYAGLADAHAVLGAYGLIPPGEARERAGAANKMALDLDDSLAEAHLSQALRKVWLSTDWHSARADFRRALELNPDFSLARSYYAMFLSMMELPEDAEREARRAMEQDPLSSFVHALAAASFYISGRYEEALELADRGMELDPGSALCRWFGAWVRRRLGALDQAVTDLERLVSDTRRAPTYTAHLAYMYAAADRKPEARKLVEELETRAATEYIAEGTLLMARLLVSDEEVLLDTLEACVETGGWTVSYATTIKPDLDRLREKPQFRDLIVALGLDPPSA